MSEKPRLDTLLVARGLVDSREKARALIMAGHVHLAGEPLLKPGQRVPEDAEILLREYEKKYVSRGGYKLEKALDFFSIDLSGAVCIDAGASTGGFTDCMLQRGAARVYAVDVGYGQLAWSLRTDARVICLERTNVRYLDRSHVPDPVDFVSADLSFISLGLVLRPLAALIHEGGQMVALVKPQFEAGREKVGKKGVVREPSVHREVLERVCIYAAQNGLAVLGLTHSPILGPEGNIEFLIRLRKGDAAGLPEPDLEDVVRSAHGELKPS
ncbi:MAG: TlyA family RNA methyltransferase [Clostridiales bacterium]|nr:TlyA family RNA methyltransferase [Clostridiales bacterium]